MSTLTHSSRFKPSARAISTVRALSAVSSSSLSDASPPPTHAALNALKNASASPQFSVTPRFRVLMAMEPVRGDGEDESAPRISRTSLSNLEFRGGVASLNHRWEKVGFAINFIAIVAAIAYVMLT